MEMLEEKVMRRVRRIHVLRRVFSATACKVYGLMLFTVGLFSTVSIAHVYANMPSIMTPTACCKFLLGAVTNTDLAVQCILAGLVVSVVMLLRDGVRGIGARGITSFAQA